MSFSAIHVCPYRWKISLINSTGHTTFCYSSYHLLRKYIFLRDLFRQDVYPGVRFEKCVKCFVDSKFIPCKIKTQQEGISQFITIPYFEQAFAGKLLAKSFERHYNVNPQCSFNTTKIKNFFSLKCPTPNILKARIVNKFSCLCNINISFIEKTKRHLGTRIKEHRSEKSAIGQHLQ